ncbi:MAG: LCP family protein [Clostridia bacterium]
MSVSFRKSKLPLVPLFIVILLVVVLICLIYLLVFKWEESLNSSYGVAETKNILEYNDNSYIIDPMIQTFMILGLDTVEALEDSESYNNEYQSDFISVVAIDNDNNEYTILQINRDTMVDIPVLGLNGQIASSYEGQITLAYNSGSGLEDSCENTSLALSNYLLDIPIDNYISISMGAVPIINDSVGGVTVTIEDDFSGADDSLVLGETITLNGEQALNFVQNRGGVSDQTNINRMARQRQYLTAFFEILEDDETSIATSLLTELSSYMVTDSTVNTLSRVIEKLEDYEFLGFVTLDGESIEVDGYMQYIVDETSLYETVIDLFYKQYN